MLAVIFILSVYPLATDVTGAESGQQGTMDLAEFIYVKQQKNTRISASPRSTKIFSLQPGKLNMTHISNAFNIKMFFENMQVTSNIFHHIFAISGHCQPRFIHTKCLFYDTLSNMPWNHNCNSDIFYCSWWVVKLVFNNRCKLKNLILIWWPINEIIPMDIFLLIHTLIIDGWTHLWTDRWPVTHQLHYANCVMICIHCAFRGIYSLS